MPRNNTRLVPQAAEALDRLKQETAAELGIPNYQGYLGDLPSKHNGAVGGNMVRKMIRLAESQLAGSPNPTALTGPAHATIQQSVQQGFAGPAR